MGPRVLGNNYVCAAWVPESPVIITYALDGPQPPLPSKISVCTVWYPAPPVTFRYA